MKITAVLPGFPPFADAPDVEAAMLVQYTRPPSEGSPDPAPVTGTMRVAECRRGTWTCSADPNLLAEALVFVQTAFTRQAFQFKLTEDSSTRHLDAPDSLAARYAAAADRADRERRARLLELELHKGRYEAADRERKARQVELELSALRKDRHEATTIVWVVRDGKDYYAGGGVGVTDPARARRYASERAALADSGWQSQSSSNTARPELAQIRVPPSWTHCDACNGRGVAPKGTGSMAIGGGPDFLCGVCRGAGMRPPPVAGVLLLPTKETRDTLLADGVPLAARLGDSVWISGKFDPAVVGDTAPLALVLAWSGVEHDGGCQRAFEVTCPGGMEKTIGLVSGRPPLRNALHRALYARRFGFGEVIYVDKDGNEVPG